ncbi:hypothetical protein E3N88_20891 [Mikania micrantha]|uniref:Uncharacterized protein n=1 Tax=Mikania micrantha TaxID=192012 RepID=A0A5N6NL45_9ASTR|nr:hypothetical protein E3N88_20891 [Mikania micrantha]
MISTELEQGCDKLQLVQDINSVFVDHCFIFAGGGGGGGGGGGYGVGGEHEARYGDSVGKGSIGVCGGGGMKLVMLMECYGPTIKDGLKWPAIWPISKQTTTVRV